MKSPRCPGCHGTGWFLDANAAGMTDPVQFELIECPYPDCDTTTTVASIVFKGPLFTHVARHPSEGYVMSCSTAGAR